MLSPKRQNVVGASEVAALFGEHPWLSRYALWHAKAGLVPLPKFDNERTQAGRTLERAIMELAAERYEWKNVRKSVWRRHEKIEGMGCTPDFEFMVDKKTQLAEIKNIDAKRFFTEWGEEPPIYYLIQAQHQLAVTGLERSTIVCLIGGNSIKKFEYERSPVVISAIEDRVREFWESIRSGKCPEPDSHAATKATLKSFHPSTTEMLSVDNDLAQRASRLLALKRQQKVLEDEINENESYIMDRLKNHVGAYGHGYSIKFPEVAVSSGKPITQDMVGTVVGARKAYRRLTVNVVQE